MGFLLPKPNVQAPPPTPTIDDAILMRNRRDSSAMRGRGTTIFTGDQGLPDLGATSAPVAKAGM